MKLVPRLILFYLDPYIGRRITAEDEKVSPLKSELLTPTQFQGICESVDIIDYKSNLKGNNDYPDLKTIIKFAEQNKMRILTQK